MSATDWWPKGPGLRFDQFMTAVSLRDAICVVDPTRVARRGRNWAALHEHRVARAKRGAIAQDAAHR
jgi:hypothetical protein